MTQRREGLGNGSAANIDLAQRCARPIRGCAQYSDVVNRIIAALEGKDAALREAARTFALRD